jgi:16S rRNA (guanine966-N2)-methyltransferase
MRIIAGSLKGRRLATPSWEGLRPTSDKLRETLFDILAARMVDARVLDGYAGTGAIGIEALSRGAAEVAFIEHDRRAQALIEKNLAHCGIAEGYAIIRATVARGLDMLREQPAFDIIVLDPPYARHDSDEVDGVMAAAADVLAPDGVLILEHARTRHAPETAGRLVRSRAVISGDSMLSFYNVCPP